MEIFGSTWFCLNNLLRLSLTYSCAFKSLFYQWALFLNFLNRLVLNLHWLSSRILLIWLGINLHWRFGPPRVWKYVSLRRNIRTRHSHPSWATHLLIRSKSWHAPWNLFHWFILTHQHLFVSNLICIRSLLVIVVIDKSCATGDLLVPVLISLLN